MLNNAKYLKNSLDQSIKHRNNFNFIKNNIMFYEFDTIKHIKNFPKYGVWYCV